MKYLKEFSEAFKLGDKLTNKSQAHIVFAVSALMLTGISIIMTVMNIRRELYIMAAITAVLAAMLLFCAYLSGVRKKEILPSVIAATVILFIFSYFAVSGQNEGFAILWILLIPLFATNIFEMRIGIGLSAYFLFFLPVLFYTPLREHVAEHYTVSFMERFPVLYLCAFTISTFVFLQKEYYSRTVHLKSNMDELTGTYNRSYFTNFILEVPLSDDVNTCIMLMDINGLKEVNDTLGHEAGDELICAVPHCCREVIKSDFTLCRVGGDEFVILIHRPEEEVAVLADRIKDAGLKWCGKYSQGCRISIGWASTSVYPTDKAEELYRIADSMMYRDKAEYYRQSGKDRRKSGTEKRA